MRFQEFLHIFTLCDCIYWLVIHIYLQSLSSLRLSIYNHHIQVSHPSLLNDLLILPLDGCLLSHYILLCLRVHDTSMRIPLSSYPFRFLFVTVPPSCVTVIHHSWFSLQITSKFLFLIIQLYFEIYRYSILHFSRLNLGTMSDYLPDQFLYMVLYLIF